MKDIILLGLGGHAHSVVDSIEQAGIYNIVGFLETKQMQERHFRDYRVLGTDDAMQEYFARGVKNAFVTIGFMGHGDVRECLYRRLKDVGYAVPDIIDTTAVVSENAGVGEGAFIGKCAVVNANAQIGKMCIINTGAVVEHDCQVGGFSHVAVRSVLCGGVSVGERTLIGANATVIQGKKIGSNSIIGAGAIVKKDVEENSMVTGIRASS